MATTAATGQGAGQSGLELLKAMLDGGAPAPSMLATLGFAPESFERGVATFVADPGSQLLNPQGTVHGGFAATLLDSAMGSAVHTLLGPGESYVTLELKVNFVRPILPGGGRLRAEGRIVHAGRTIATAEGRLIGVDDGRLYAHGTTTCMVVRPAGPR